MTAALLLALAVPAADTKEAPRFVKPATVGVGRYVPDATFTDLAGKPGKLSDYKSSKLLVVAATGTSCPLCGKFGPTLAKVEAEFAGKGVAFLFVNPVPTDTPAACADMAKRLDLKGRYTRDEMLAATLKLRTTTEVVVLDSARTVQYRGAVDDQYGLGYATDAPTREYLRPALTALLAGNTPEYAATTAPGCELDLPKVATAPTYHNRISRIVQQNCQECHRSGGVGPFPLDSADDVKSHGGMIRKVLSNGTMPPWFATPDDHKWLNDRALTAADKADLLAWLKLAPLGDPADAPLPRTFAADGWAIGKPDAVIELSKPAQVKATGTMPYHLATVETKFDEDKWVTAYEVKPTAPAVVHHVLVHVVPQRTVDGIIGRLTGGGGPRNMALRADAEDERQGYFAAYVPGNASYVLPAGYAKRLPKGAVLRFQIHYTPTGTATEDRTRVAFQFADAPPKYEVRVAGVAQPRISIPPGADNHKEVAKLMVPFDVTLLSFVPHLHVRGKAAKYELTADGKTTTLLDVPRYDFNWQLRYELAEPVKVSRGSTLHFTAWYDNSEKNPANPDPTKQVRWGQQTSDEMHIGYVEYRVERK
jgi:thiol-disulfide isomerase/thioredoxin